MDFRKTWLWQQAFEAPRPDSTLEEQQFFLQHLLSTRENASYLIGRVSNDLPGYTLHDITHSDALWDSASLIVKDLDSINPPEAFVLGAAFLLHDAGMSLAAFEGGLDEVKQTTTWKDVAARFALLARGAKSPAENASLQNDTECTMRETLRLLHAEKAASLAKQKWTEDGRDSYLIDNPELRSFYGQTIGAIAHSHWWSIEKVENTFIDDLGALANRTHCRVDRLKLACILRIADAIHLDGSRAPYFLRSLLRPSAASALHWTFQEKMARPHIEHDALVFTTGAPFEKADCAAWWLASDTLKMVDRELNDVHLLLRERGKKPFNVRRVKGAESPQLLSNLVQTTGWKPIDAQIRATDVPRLVENLGGARMYGGDTSVPVRELIQNAADAIQARRRLEGRADNWGLITISLEVRDGKYWFTVADNGIGMSERVLTGPLIDFGTSFWQSTLALEEFPGLMAAGMSAIGRFGIGFFSTFMLGSSVRVFSRRCDSGHESGRLLEFLEGTSTRPILSHPSNHLIPIDGGTRVEILLEHEPTAKGGLLNTGYGDASHKLDKFIGAIAPNLSVAIEINMLGNRTPVLSANDWLSISGVDLLSRLETTRSSRSREKKECEGLMREIRGLNGEVYGRAFISASPMFHYSSGGWVTVSGLRACRLHNVEGVLLGESETAARDTARPLATHKALSEWATDQAKLIAKRIKSEKMQAHTAEVVLECGGSIGPLKIMQWKGVWMNAEAFRRGLRTVDSVAICFNHVDYEADLDSMHPKEFESAFEINDEVAFVPEHDGAIISRESGSWPDFVEKENRFKSRLEGFVKSVIKNAWGDYLMEKELRSVGVVAGVDVMREIAIFYKRLQSK